MSDNVLSSDGGISIVHVQQSTSSSLIERGCRVGVTFDDIGVEWLTLPTTLDDVVAETSTGLGTRMTAAQRQCWSWWLEFVVGRAQRPLVNFDL